MVSSGQQPIRGLASGTGEGVAVFADRRALIERLQKCAEVARGTAASAVEVGELRICPFQRTATWRGSPLRLTPREFDILHLLAECAGTVLSRHDIFDLVWETSYAGQARLVDEHIMKVRRKLGDGARFIETIWGIGYRFVLPGDHPVR